VGRPDGREKIGGPQTTGTNGNGTTVVRRTIGGGEVGRRGPTP